MSTFFLHNAEIYGWQIDGNILTLSPSNVLTINPFGAASSINAIPIGNTTPSTGAFTTLSSGTASFTTSLSVGGTGPITGFGTNIGQVPQWINYQGSGLPGLLGASRMIFRRATPGVDSIDFQFIRDTSTTTIAGAPLMTSLRMGQVVGPNDTSNNWATLSTITTKGVSGGLAVGAYLQGVRASTGTDPFWGAVIEGRDQNHNPTSAVAGAHVSLELDLYANNVDDGTNAATYGGVGKRKGINIVVQQDDNTDATVATYSNALWIGSAGSKAVILSGIGFSTTTYAYSAVDTRGIHAPSANPVNALTMSAGQVVDFNGGAALTSAPGRYLVYNSGSAKLQYINVATERFSISDAGGLGQTAAIAWSGSAQTPAFDSTQAHSGTSSTNSRLNSIQITDTVATSGSTNGFNLIHNYGLSSGSRNALNVALVQQNGANTDTGADKFYVAATVQAFGRQTQPGSSATTPLGRVFGLNAVGQIQAGFTATNLYQVASAEFDVGISSGSSAAHRTGVTIADLAGTAQGYRSDNMLWFYGGGTKWRYGINFSDDQTWPIDTSVGTMIGAKYGGGHNASDMAAMWGVDLQQVTFPATGNPYEGGGFRSKNFAVDGAGTMQIGTTFLTPGSTGLAIDAKGAIGTAATISTAGSGYEAGTIVITAYGGVWTVPIVAGVPTGTVTALVQPVISSTTPPSNPITPTNLNLASVGTGLTINITWNTTATTLALNPTGGPTTTGGTLGTAGNITATAGGGSISIQPNVTNGVIDAGTANLVIKSGAGGTAGLVNCFPTLQAPSIVMNKAAVTTGTVIGLKQGIALTGSSSTSPASINLLNMSSDIVAATNGLSVLNIAHQFGNTGMTGTRNSLLVNSTFTAASSNSGSTGYGPTNFTMTALANDGGTGVTAVTSKGAAFGVYGVVNLGAAATNWAAACHELDYGVTSGGSVMDLVAFQVVGLSTHAVQGARDDVGISLNNQFAPGAGLGLKVGLGFGRQGGQFPIATDGTMVYGQGNLGAAFTVAQGIDWHLGTATGNWLNLGAKFIVSGTGKVTLSDVINLKAYTVATLPAAATAGAGAMAYVSDATAPTYNGVLIGGGTVKVPVFCDGTTWTSH